jgi:hypothetical protein
MARILYLSRNARRPVGGVRNAERHVEVLARRGYDARLLLPSIGNEHFSPRGAPVLLSGPKFMPLADDYIVVPEPWHRELVELSRVPGRKLVFCQNHYLMFHGLAGARDYGAYGVSRVFALSHVIAAFVERALGLKDVPVVPTVIDRQMFRPHEKRRQIVCMPRKMMREAQMMMPLFRVRHPDLADVPWTAIDDMPEEEVARRLGQSAVFLSLSVDEGLGFPPLEAMAAGALVAGFHGEGGRDYATPENGEWVAPDDVIGAVDALARVMRIWDAGGPEAQARRAAGFATAARYSAAAMEEALVAFWAAELARP